MFNLFKKKEKESQAKNDQGTVDASELLDEEVEASSEEEVYPSLSTHPDWKLNEEDTYVYRFINNDLPPLKPNQISLHSYELRPYPYEFVVDGFIRSSLPKSIKLKETTILLLDKEGKKVARKEFDLGEAGTIPAHSSRPWGFLFSDNDLFIPREELPVEGFKLAFELKKSTQKHSLDLAESWQQSMADHAKEELEQFINKMTPPKPGEVNFLGLKATQTEEGDLHVTMLIRNGSDKTINLEQLPLQVEDASGEVIAQGGFKLNDFEVKANTSKPWTFIFPQSMINRDTIDLTKWKAYPIQNK